MSNKVEYEIIGKYTNGVELIGYQMRDMEGCIKTFNKSNAELLMQRGQVLNCKMIESDGVNHVCCSGFKLSNIPDISIQNKNTKSVLLTLSGRLFQDGKLIGYVVTDERGQEYNLSKEKVWESARNNNISNASAQYNNGNKILRGVGIELRELELIRV